MEAVVTCCLLTRQSIQRNAVDIYIVTAIRSVSSRKTVTGISCRVLHLSYGKSSVNSVDEEAPQTNSHVSWPHPLSEQLSSSPLDGYILWCPKGLEQFLTADLIDADLSSRIANIPASVTTFRRSAPLKLSDN
jgi:hypothetical protein